MCSAVEKPPLHPIISCDHCKTLPSHESMMFYWLSLLNSLVSKPNLLQRTHSSFVTIFPTRSRFGSTLLSRRLHSPWHLNQHWNQTLYFHFKMWAGYVSKEQIQFWPQSLHGQIFVSSSLFYLHHHTRFSLALFIRNPSLKCIQTHSSAFQSTPIGQSIRSIQFSLHRHQVIIDPPLQI